MRDRLPEILDYLRTGIWTAPPEEASRTKAAFTRALKTLLLAGRRFQEDRCTLRASALTFYSVLSVVPLVAMAFGIAKGFGFEKRLQALVLEKFTGQEQVLLKVFEFSSSLLQRTRGGIIAGIGIALLFLTVVRILGYIEESFNGIWKVKRSRRPARKFSDYLSVMMVCPLIFIMASSITVTMASQVESIVDRLWGLGLPAAPILLLLKILPFLLIWMMFAFVFLFMPNTKVRWKAGIVAAVVAGTAYQLTQWVYVTFQVGVSRANAIYGSFAALPLFMAWMQISWLIVLSGSALSYAIQNLDVDGPPVEPPRSTPFRRKVHSLRIARLVIRNFAEGGKPPTPSGIASALGIPLALVREIVSDLAAASLFSIVAAAPSEENACQPARDIRKITVKDVLDAVEMGGPGQDRRVFLPEEDHPVLEALQAIDQAVGKSPANGLVVDL